MPLIQDLYLPFIKSDTVISTKIIIVDLIEISTLSENTPATSSHNSDKSSGNTLLLSSQATEKNQSSTVSECIKPQLKKNERNMLFLLL